MGTEVFDNVTKILRDDLLKTIQKGSKLSIATERFSIFAFEELRKQLENIDELRFIFTSPTFVTERSNEKEDREFYIPRLDRERSLYGDKFEVKLRNELNQKSIARECAEWIQKKVRFRSNISRESMNSFMTVDSTLYNPFNGFTLVGLGCERGASMMSFVNKIDSPQSAMFQDAFDALWQDRERLQDVTEEVVENIAAAYNENSPESIYAIALHNIFHEFLSDISEDELPKEETGYKNSQIWRSLYNFQRDAALAIINKLERYNGCILADSVGLGKTFTALAVIKYYEQRNRLVLVLCPKKLGQNWNTYRSNYRTNPLHNDRFRYDVLYHTDLSRTKGESNGYNLELLNWENYDLVVIDESHNFRNGGAVTGGDEPRENRYRRLLNQVICKGVKTKVLMLSATPVNNRFNDLKNQLALAYEGDSANIDGKLKLNRSIDDIFKNAQRAFNQWSKLDVSERTTANLLKSLNFDFFELLDAVTIARSRKHVERYYDTTDIGKFPERLKPISISPDLTDLRDSLSYGDIFERLSELKLAIYTPSSYIFDSHKAKYAEIFGDELINKKFTQENREIGIRRLMAINLMKRMESSVHSFRLTVSRVKSSIESLLTTVKAFLESPNLKVTVNERTFADDKQEWDDDDQGEEDQYTIGKKVQIDLRDMDALSWANDLEDDLDILNDLLDHIQKITPARDLKLQTLLKLIESKIKEPINEGNKKVLIFTAFADTAEYLYGEVSRFVKEKFGLHSAMISGSSNDHATIPIIAKDSNAVLACFSPCSRKRDVIMPDEKRDVDVLVATDCISEGQNLQDCDYVVNYDIHWNPVRIIQRFGRIDRIGSKNDCVQLVNFWPNVSLDEYIELRRKVETRMKAVDLAATGDDNIINDEERVELEYRKNQLNRLKTEVLDLEETSQGVSIMDLGLNEFRFDLLEYSKRKKDLEQTPFGLCAVVGAKENAPKGVIFVLKNRSESFRQDRQNRLHPFYLVYIDSEGSVVADYLSPKEVLEKMRYLCKGKDEPIPELFRPFNKETRDGKNMSAYSELLGGAVESIVRRKEERRNDSVFRPGGLAAFNDSIRGLDDFELICFLVVREQ